MASKLSSFLAKLKRRKVYQVAGVYVMIAFALWERADDEYHLALMADALHLEGVGRR